MKNWLKQDLDLLIKKYKEDLDMISRKDKDDEWKRDHYRYTSAVAFQRILNLLNTSITDTPPAPLQQSTISELEELKKIIDAAISG
jgi:hypothetical protein